MKKTKNEQRYVRFHVRVDEALTRASESTGLKRATLVAWILSTYLRTINEKIERGEISLVPMAAPDTDAPTALRPEDLGISPLSLLYSLKIGRSEGHAPRMIGKGLLVTLPPAEWVQLSTMADLCEMSVNHFRSAVVATFLIEQQVLT